MLEVWGRRNASNVMPVMWAIGELDLPHVRHDIGGSFAGADRPEYLAMNPNGRIPTINDDGFVLWESNAIVRYLSRQDGRGTLWPESDKLCAIADQWMDWHKTTLYPPYIDLVWAIVRTEPALRSERQIAVSKRAAESALQVLEAQLAKTPFVAGSYFTMADVPMGALIYRYLQLGIGRPDFPSIKAWYRRLTDRPAYQEHVMFPFGTCPAEWYLLERELGPSSGRAQHQQ